ncbi:MAG: ABC transporter ATP-binding protein [Planctomycetota bacterium]|nr:MAG: ABC transporter ATP-binding protein [Planctomycetota bacterium]
MSMPAPQPLVRCLAISKYFGGVKALDGVTLELYAGEVVALVGDNGAGKSTLVRILAGFYHPDQGELWFGQQRVDALSPRQARALGVETVHQHLLLCDNLGAAANVVLGQEPTVHRLGPLKFLDHRRGREEAARRLAEVGASISDLATPIRQLSGGQRQAIAIARALAASPRLVMFDEPTAALGSRQTEATLRLIRRVAERGVAALLISHNLDDVFAVADRIVALRHGRPVFNELAGNALRETVVAAMTGLLTERTVP